MGNRIDRMKELVKELNEASHAYYVEDREIISNQSYDMLYDELVALEEALQQVLANSPTKTVGALDTGAVVVSSLVQVAHDIRILSLDKTKNPGDLRNFLTEHLGLLSWKLDGLTVVLTYLDGKLDRAITRGNGRIGEDITHNAKVFENLPLAIAYQPPLTIRGEAMISYENFDIINSRLPIEEAYKNPRNLASGTVRQLNSQVVRDRKVSFFAFSMMSGEDNSFFNDSKGAQLSWLESLGFQVVAYEKVTSGTVEGAVSICEEKINGASFGSDGLVITLDSLSYSASLGATSKFPKDSLAFKWADELAESSMIGVEWNTARTGLINPVGIFEAVEIEGSVVSRASLHNVSIFEALELGVGDIVSVYKANMIIPQIAENFTRSGGISLPGHCPSCGYLARVEEANGVKTLLCDNIHCKAQLIHRINHFASRDAMDIRGLSEQTIHLLIDEGFLRGIYDVFTLQEHEGAIIQLPGFGKRRFDNIMNGIEKSKETPLYQFIYGLGIPHVGLSTATLIGAHFNHQEEPMIHATATELLTIDGVGEVIANSYIHFWQNKENKEEALKIMALLERKAITTNQIEPNLQGYTFVITGSLTHFLNRKELSSFITNRGGKVSGTVSGNTNYVINNDMDSASSKNKAAKERQIPIISELEFRERFE